MYLFCRILIDCPVFFFSRGSGRNILSYIITGGVWPSSQPVGSAFGAFYPELEKLGAKLKRIVDVNLQIHLTHYSVMTFRIMMESLINASPRVASLIMEQIAAVSRDSAPEVLSGDSAEEFEAAMSGLRVYP